MDDSSRPLASVVASLEKRLAAAEAENARLVSENALLRQKVSHQPSAVGQDDRNETLAGFFLLSLDLLCIADFNGEFVRLNPEWEQVLGYPAAELIGRKFMEFVHPEDIDATAAALARLNSRQDVLNFENRYRCRDGSYRWIEWRSRPSGGLIYAAARDISRRKNAEEVLVRKDALLGAMLRNLPFDFWARDTGQRIILQSDASVAFWGDLLSDTRFQSEVGNHIYERWRSNNSRVLAGEIISEECTYITKDGELRDFHQILAPIRDDVEILGILGINIDITEQKRAEEEVRMSNELLASFISNSPIYAFIKEVSPGESRVLKASENFLEMIGIPGSQMAGKTMQELFPADFADKITDDDWRVVSRGEILRLDEELQGRYYTTIKFPILFGGKNFLAGYTIDLTERRLAEEALRESEKTFRNIVHALPMGVHLYQLQGDGRLVFVGANPVADELLGLDNSQFIGMTVEEAFPPLGETDIPDRYRRAAQHGESWHTEQISYTDGQVSGAFEVFVFQMAEGKAAVLFSEISSRKRAEDEREKLQAQLIQAQKMESVGRLAGGVAHDFNNMLGVILGHTELAMNRLDPEHPLFVSLQHIRKAAERSANLTRQLLAFARKQTVMPKVLDLNDTLEGMLTMVARLIGEDIDLVWIPGRNLPPVEVDPSQIDQILVNLCVNARDAIGDTGKLTIETGIAVFDEDYCTRHAGFVPGEYILLAVSDNGCGMDAAILSHLFEPFFTTKEVGKGTGLGLATVYGIVKQNKGFISVYSEPGQGTTFRIYLPPHTAKAARPVRTEVAAPTEHGHETILLVEDEPMILDLTMAMLKTLGYTVLSAATPGEAIRLAREHSGQIHLLLTDVVMPEMNGRDLARKLLSLYPELKRLFMSGYTANVIAHHGVLDAGVHFLQKPFSIGELAAKIREALQPV
jgi:two-component system, cell cycle sensor histidine kinase and response regulator CckA